MAFNNAFKVGLLAGTTLLGSALAAQAVPQAACPVSYSQLKSALTAADTADTSGLNNHFWGVVVDRTGVVCAVAFSGASTGSQWLASRQIAAAKAFTADSLSLNLNGSLGGGFGALSTAELYQFVQPSNNSDFNPLFGLNGGNVLDSTIAYQGNYNNFGTTKDPMIGYRVGGTITFGGGLALYTGSTVVGGLGLSGDTACADHSTAWRTRINLGMNSDGSDKLTFATKANNMQDGHPHCPNDTLTQGSFDPATGVSH